MNNSINHKFHHISRVEYQELLAVSRGDAVADYIIDMLDFLPDQWRRNFRPIVIKGRYFRVAEDADVRLWQDRMLVAMRAAVGFLMLTCILNPA